MAIDNIKDVNLSTDNEAEGITKLNENFDLVETHDHTTGKGNPITPSAISINEDLDFSGNHAVNLGAVVLVSATNTIVNGSLYFDAASGNLAVRDLDGNIVNIVKNGAIDTSTSGNIGGLTGDAALTYYSDDNIFEFIDDSGAKAKIDCKDITLTSGQGGSIILTSAQTSGTNVTVTIPNQASTLVAQDGNSLRLSADTSANVGTPASNHITVFADSADSNRPKYKTSDGTLTAFGEGSSAGVVGSHNFVTDGGFDSLEANAFTSTGGTVSTATGTNALRGTKSIEWTGYADGNDLTFDETIVIGPGYRGFLNISFRYTGAPNLSVELFDFTGKTGTEAVGNQIGSAIAMTATNGALGNEYATFSADIDIPSTITQFKFRLTGTGAAGVGIIFDDLGVSTDLANIDVLIDTVSFTGGVNVVSNAKINQSNDPTTTTVNVGNHTATVTLTETTDWVEGGDWIESITSSYNWDKASGVPFALTNGRRRHIVTSVANFFDETTLPVIDLNFSSVVNAVLVSSTDGITNDPEITSASFSGNKLIIVIDQTFSASVSNGTVTPPRFNFNLSITKIAGFGAATLTTTPKKNVFSYQETLDQHVEYTADYAINSGDISISDVTNQQKNGVAFTWISSVNDNANTGQIDFLFNTAETGFTVIPEINMIPSNSSGATQGWIANSTTAQFRYNGQSLVNGNVSMITQSGRIVVKPSGADVPKPMPVGSYIIQNTQPLGTIIDSILTETQLNSNASGNWVLCDGRSIANSALATLASISVAPDLRGRYTAMAGVANGLDAKVLNETLASEVKASDVALTDPGHTHTFTISTASSGSGASAGLSNNTQNSTTGSNTTGITISAGDETRPETYVTNKFIRID